MQSSNTKSLSKHAEIEESVFSVDIFTCKDINFKNHFFIPTSER